MDDWQGQVERAAALVEAGRLSDAAPILSALIETHADSPVVAHLQGVTAFGLGQNDIAVDWLRRAAKGDESNAEIWNNLGQAYRARGDLSEAVDAFAQAGERDGEFAEPLNNLGMLFRNVGKFDQAIECYEDALARRPDYPEAHFNLALVYEQLGDWRPAAQHYEQAIEKRSDYVAALSNLGGLRSAQGRHTEAEEYYRRALNGDPHSSAILSNLGDCLRAQGKLEDAVQSLAEALRFDPERAEAHFNLALIQLARGEFAGGWSHYRYRHSVDRADHSMPADRWPSALAGRRILLEGEQGLGDQLYFLRFVAEIVARGARVQFRPDVKLAPLCHQIGGLERILGPTEAADADETRALADIPFLLGVTKTPPPLPLAINDVKRAEISAQLSAFGPPPYVGLTYRAGIDAAGSLFKDAPIDGLAACLAEIPMRVVNLQRAPGAGETARLERALGRPTLDLTDLNGDMEAMLAALDLLDDYVGVSNTNMHLRAALGHPARVLVTHPAEYRWMADGVTSPWFPDFTLYRQAVGDDWSSAFSSMRHDLAAAYGG